MKFGYYTSEDLAMALGVSPQCIRAKLREKYPRHRHAWWRFTQAEYDQLTADLAILARRRKNGDGG